MFFGLRVGLQQNAFYTISFFFSYRGGGVKGGEVGANCLGFCMCGCLLARNITSAKGTLCVCFCFLLCDGPPSPDIASKVSVTYV